MNVIQDLAARAQWLLWRWENDTNGRRTKVPYAWHGRKASSTDPSTWTTVQQCAQALDLFDGLGFVFTEMDDVVGVDLDGCRNPATGDIEPWARNIIESLASYAEVSPSQNGVKIFCRGKLPANCKHKRKLDLPDQFGKQPEIEIYDKGRFFCYTGQAVEGSPLYLAPAQDALDKLVEVRQPRRMPDFSIPRPDAGSVERRAAAYIERIPFTQCGTASCHDRTFQVACDLVIGFELPDGVALRLMDWWQAQGTHQWQEHELRHKIESARQHAEGRPGYLRDAERKPEWEQVADKVDLSGILNEADSEPQRPEDDDSGPVDDFPMDLIFGTGGFIQELVTYNLKTAMYPQPVLALSGALALLAALTGRRICDEFDTRTNMYILALAPSGGGKEHARKICKDVLNLAQAGEMIGNERVASHAGLITEIVECPNALFLLDEFGRFLATSKDASRNPHLYNVASVLMALYSVANTIWTNDAYADRKKRKTIDQPNPVVYGTTVPNSLWANLTVENLTDGLVSRMLVFEAHGYVELTEPGQEPIPESVIEQARNWHQFKPGGNLWDQHPTQQTFEHTPEARRRYLDHVREISKRRMSEDSNPAAIWSRGGEKTAKFALLFAASRQPPDEMGLIGQPKIDLQDVESAIRLSNYMTRTLLAKAEGNVTSSRYEEDLNRFSNALRGRWRTKAEVVRATRWLNKRTRDELLDHLMEEGVLEVRKEQTSHKETTYIRCAR